MESKFGNYSIFRVTLCGVEIAMTEALADKQEQHLDFDSIVFEPATILIADDIDYNREVLSTYLDQWQFKLLQAPDGKVALRLAETHNPDLILLDMKMPEMDGYEASKILKGNKDLKMIPIIAVTASALKQDEETIAKLCDGYLRKPVSKSELIAKMIEFLPHSIRENKKIVQEITIEKSAEPLTAKLFQDYPELLKELKNHSEQAKELVRLMLITRGEELSEVIKDLASHHQCIALSTWADETARAASRFEIDRFKQLMKEFITAIQ